MAKYTDYQIEEAKYLINKFIKYGKKPDFTDIPKHYIMENVIFHNFHFGYLTAMANAKDFCENGFVEEAPSQCRLCPHKEYCPKMVREKETLK